LGTNPESSEARGKFFGIEELRFAIAGALPERDLGQVDVDRPDKVARVVGGFASKVEDNELWVLKLTDEPGGIDQRRRALGVGATAGNDGNENDHSRDKMPAAR